VRVAIFMTMLGLLVGGAAAGAQERDGKPNWSVHPLTLRQPVTDDKTMPVWIGMRNERRTPQLVCVLSEGYVIGTTSNPYAASAGAAHACREDDQFTIVLPGETYFYVMAMDLRKDWRTGPLQLSLILADFDDSGERHSSDVKWSGRLASLVEAGKHLAPKRQPR
jgi:hypothetical protein